MTGDETSDAVAQAHGKLARMAGQIAGYFRAYPEDKAVAAIAEHINQFWSPRMREDLIVAHRSGELDLDPLTQQALHLVRRPHTSVAPPA